MFSRRWLALVVLCFASPVWSATMTFQEEVSPYPMYDVEATTVNSY